MPKIVSKAKVIAPLVGASDYSARLVDQLRDPIEAAAYLDAAIEAGDSAALLLAMRNVAAANGGISAVAQQTGFSRESLYRSLSARGNPTVQTLSGVLGALGLRLSVQPA
jgi:probable addiction module antidote protein